jgi:hypothetical protein
MRRIFCIVAFVSITLGLCSGSEGTKPRFALYLVKAHHAEMKQSELESEPLLTEQDIVSYDWPTHTIALTKSGEKKIPDIKAVGTGGVEFVIVADGQRCYRGAFWASLSSQSHGEPVIDVLRRGRTLQIQRAYPDASFAVGDDPRSDPRILQALEAAGKIKKAQPTAPADADKSRH